MKKTWGWIIGGVLLIAVALDCNEDDRIRTRAAATLSEIGDTVARAALRPLALGPIAFGPIV